MSETNSTITPLIQEYIVDLASNNNFFFINAVQGDSKTRYVRISLTNNGQPYYIDESNADIAVRGTTPNGDQYLDVSTTQIVDTSTIMFELTRSMLLYPGRGTYEVCVMSKSDATEQQLLTSFPFYVVVTESGFDTKGITESQSFVDLVNTLITVEETVSTCVDTVERCEDAVTTCVATVKKSEDNAAEYEELKVQENINLAKQATADAEAAAIRANEAANSVQKKIGIDDEGISLTTTWSSSYIENYIVEKLVDHPYFYIEGSEIVNNLEEISLN